MVNISESYDRAVILYLLESYTLTFCLQILHVAAQNGRTGIVKDLLLEGADVNKGNNHRNSALHLAAQNGWTELAEILLKVQGTRYTHINGAATL